MAGGQGTRLRPLTLDRPKPMVEVLGRPVIDYVKDAMQAAGLSEVIVTTGYRGEMLAEHITSWSIPGRINQEEVPMGTAGSVRLLLDELDSTFVVGSGDSVASFDIADLIATHKRVGAKVTMALWRVEDPTEFGIVGLSENHQGEVDGALSEGWISRFKEKPTSDEAFSNLINAGLYIIEPEVLARVPEGQKFDFSKQLFPMILEDGWPMYAKTIDGVWYDVGHPMELLKAQMTLIEKRGELPFPFPNGEVQIDGGFHAAGVIAKSTRSVLLDGVKSEGEVVESLLMANCFVHSGAIVTGSILGEGCVVEEGASISNCVIGPGERIIENAILEGIRVPE